MSLRKGGEGGTVQITNEKVALQSWQIIFKIYNPGEDVANKVTAHLSLHSAQCTAHCLLCTAQYIALHCKGTPLKQSRPNVFSYSGPFTAVIIKR